MNQNRWKTVNEIFHAALELPSGERERFILDASQGDSELQSEVERMLAADEKAAGYLESHTLLDGFLGSISLIQPGDVLKERFRIRRLLGEGGMGQVFEAWDEELKIPIAVKAIRPEISEHSGMRSSFRREVRIARSITHLNVCRIYELDRAIVERGGDVRCEMLFLTMEYLEGETLAVRLNRTGPLPIPLALTYARQIASALDAAHAAGIVHRDIKPANVMLVDSVGGGPDSTRVVVTDFGLARGQLLLSGAQHSSASLGVPAGTIAYMAPEQMEASAVVTTAIDIYAFGLVLFEMVTGRRAFPATNLLTGITQRLSGPPPSPRFLNPDVPEKWEIAIQTCLCRDPSERFSSASAVVEALEDTGSSPLRSEPIRIPASSAEISVHFRPWRHRWAIVITGLLIMVSLFAAWFRLYRQKAESKVVPGALVYLTQIQNQTGVRAFDNMNELLKASLGQSTQINLLDQSRVGDTLQLMTKPPSSMIDAPIAREIAMRTGAVRIIFATLTSSAGTYKLDVDIQQPDNTPTRARNDWAQSFEWKTASGQSGNGSIAPEILHTIRDAADWIRAKTGESANDIARLDTPPGDVTTSSWEALEDYATGERFAAQSKRDDAIASFQQATISDPHFSLAYARMGDILLNLGRALDGYRAYQHALDSEADTRLSLRERDRIKGYYALDSWNYEGAVAAFHDYLLYYPNDYIARTYLAYSLIELGQTEQAIAALKRAYALSADRGAAPEHLAMYFLFSGNLEESRQWNATLQHTDAAEESNYILGLQKFYDRRYREAGSALAALTQSKDWFLRSLGLSMATRLAADSGDYLKAETAAKSALEEAVAAGSVARRAAALLDLSSLDCQQGRYESCLTTVREAVRLDQSPRSFIAAASIMGEALPATHGLDSIQIRSELHLLQQTLPGNDDNPVYHAARLHLEGENLLANGRASQALLSFRKAIANESVMSSQAAVSRAAMAAASEERDPSKAAQFEQIALLADIHDVEQPGARWHYTYFEQPGHFAKRLTSFVALARRMGLKSNDTRQAEDTLTRLRESGDRTAFHPQ